MAQSDAVELAVRQIREVEPGKTLEELMGELRPIQLDVLEALMEGDTIKGVAESLAVGRSTIHTWISKDPYFKAAYNMWMEEVGASVDGKITAILGAAAENVNKAVAGGDTKLSYLRSEERGHFKRKQESTEPVVVRQQM